MRKNGLAASLDTASWTPPPLFALIQRTGDVEPREMWRTFNMGVGMVIAIAPDAVTLALSMLPGAWRIGDVVPRAAGAPAVQGLAPGTD